MRQKSERVPYITLLLGTLVASRALLHACRYASRPELGLEVAWLHEPRIVCLPLLIRAIKLNLVTRQHQPLVQPMWV